MLTPLPPNVHAQRPASEQREPAGPLKRDVRQPASSVAEGHRRLIAPASKRLPPRSLFRSAVKGIVGKCARLIAFVAVGVEPHAPDLLGAEVSQPTEAEWNLAYPVEVLLACLVENVKEWT